MTNGPTVKKSRNMFGKKNCYQDDMAVLATTATTDRKYRGKMFDVLGLNGKGRKGGRLKR